MEIKPNCVHLKHYTEHDSADFHSVFWTEHIPFSIRVSKKLSALIPRGNILKKFHHAIITQSFIRIVQLKDRASLLEKSILVASEWSKSKVNKGRSRE